MGRSVILIFSLVSLALSASWPFWGLNLQNSHNKPSSINTHNVANLVQLWNVSAPLGIRGIPSVCDETVYTSDGNGTIYAVGITHGNVIWRTYLPSITRNPASNSRITPTLHDGLVIVGDQVSGTLFALRADTGSLVWQTLLDSHPAAIITTSPVIFEGNIYAGVSSNEEDFASVVPGYVCCSFRGSFLSINLYTGHINWKVYLMLEGWAGASVWASSPSIDPSRNSVYIATGNTYFVPPSAQSCLSAGRNNCVPYNNYAESVLSLDLTTGAIRWVAYFNRKNGLDVWNAACPGTGFPYVPSNCPLAPGPDADFAQMPMLFGVLDSSGHYRDALGIGSKSGVFTTLDRSTGAFIWATVVGPGGQSGGLQFGSAFDQNNVYTAISNLGSNKPYIVNGVNITYGSFAALDKNTGRIVWQVPDPFHFYNYAALTITNDVLIGSDVIPGVFYGLATSTGAVLWTSFVGEISTGGASVVEDKVFFGTGGFGESGHLFAYGLSRSP
jgi:polyvinyl alcohol dehydrogenase (cytochrome)